MSQAATEQSLRREGLDLLKRGELDAAIAIFKTLLAGNRNNVEALAALGAAFSQKGMHAHAIKVLDRSVELKPTAAALHFNRGLALERAGKLLLAGEAFEETLRLNPVHPSAQQRLSMLEATLAGGGLPVATPDDEMPVAQFDDELPAATPDDELPSAAPEELAIDDGDQPSAIGHRPDSSLSRTPRAESRQPHLPPRPSTPAPSKSRPVTTPAPLTHVRGSDPASKPRPMPSPSPSPSPGSSPMRPSPSPSPSASPGLPPIQRTIVEQHNAHDDNAVIVAPVEEEILDVLPADAPLDVPPFPHTMAFPPPPPASGRAALTLAEGESFESWVTFEVSEAASGHLTLRSRNATAFLWILAAPLSLILAVILIVFLINGFMEGSRISGRGLVGLFFGLLFVLGLCIAAIYKLRQIGSKLTLDAGSRYVEQTRWFGMSRQTWAGDDLAAVQVWLTAEANDPDSAQELKVALVSPDGQTSAEIGEEKVAKEESAVLLTVAAYASHLLRIPLQIDGRPREACDGLNDVYSIVGRPGWAAYTTFDTIGRAEARRSGLVRASGPGGLAKVGMIIHGVFGLSFVAFALLLAMWGAFPWEGALACAAFVGVGIILFINGLTGIREKRIHARHGLHVREYKGSTALMIGWGQIAAGMIPVLAIPLVLMLQANWSKLLDARSSSSPPIVSNPPPVTPPGSNLPGAQPDQGKPAAPQQDPVDKALADLKSGDDFAQMRAADELARSEPNAKRAEVAKALSDRLTSSNLLTRRSCLNALKKWGGKDEVPVLITVVDDTDIQMRKDAIELLGKLKAVEAAGPISERLADFQTRGQAAAALREIGSPAEKAVAQKLQHKDNQVRREAVRILRDIATKESVPALREACDDEDRSVSLPARAVLLRLGENPPPLARSGSSRPKPNDPPPAGSGDKPIDKPADKPMDKGTEEIDKLIADLKSPFDSNKRRAACDELQKKEPTVKREEVAIALNQVLEDREPLTRKAAVKALATWAVKENVPNINKLLEDRDSFVKAAVYETLVKLKDERSVDPIAKRLEDPTDRLDASKALQEMGSMVEKTVILGLRSRTPEVRAEVCRIIKAVGTKDSVPTLNQFVIANRTGDRIAANLANEAIKAINEREKDKEKK